MMYYVVVTEEYYGGENRVMLFQNKQSAEDYKTHLEKQYNCNVLILAREIADEFNAPAEKIQESAADYSVLTCDKCNKIQANFPHKTCDNCDIFCCLTCCPDDTNCEICNGPYRRIN